MRRVIVSLVVVTLVAFGLLGATRSPHYVFGQSASPSPGDQVPEGVSFQFIAYGQLPPDMQAPEGFSMFRLALDPGASFPADKNDPTTALGYVEKGTLTLMLEMDITVLHAGTGNQEPTAQDFEMMPANQRFTMTVGDSAIFPANTAGTVTNDGAEQAILLIAQLEPPGYSEGEMATPGAGMGTPSS
jgi:quercetin dioxygenase-like cupin family protein